MARPFRNLARLILFVLAMNTVVAGATTVRAYWYNQQGVLKFMAKSYYPAYQSFMNALEEDPLNPAVQLNLARTFEVNEEYEKAEQTYIGALRLSPEGSELRFQTLFNLAFTQVKQKKFDQALNSYQLALAIHPDSKEVKNNIELMWQQGGGEGGEGKDDKDKKDKEGKDKDQKKDGQGNEDKKDDKKDDKGQKPEDKKDQKKPQPKPFESKDLNDQDVKKILDEIKNQEQSIRAQEYERNPKEAPRGKDW